MSKLSSILALVFILSTAATASAITPTLECDNSSAGVVLCHVNDIGNSENFCWDRSGGINLFAEFFNAASFTCGMNGASGSVSVNFTDPDTGIRYFFGQAVTCLPCGQGGSQ